jgi:membrane associated rhomboid family serine protease
VHGYFHEEASLCSQVLYLLVQSNHLPFVNLIFIFQISCLNDICGMFPFFTQDVPDQFYRLFTSLCLHAGILQLLITVALQHIFLSDLERLLGPMRTAILYITSGIAGNLISSILVPYKPEVPYNKPYRNLNRLSI